MRAAFTAAVRAEPDDVRRRLSLVDAGLGPSGRLSGAADGRRFDVVLLHGVLMYLDPPGPAVVQVCDLVAPGGVLSLLARNGAALALRPGLRGQWSQTLAALDEACQDRPGYVNELGVPARADRLETLASYVSGRRMHVEAWYGVRVLTDGVSADEPAPADPIQLAALLDAEERAGCTDPYRRVAPLLHIVGRRGT
jgi:S-adenosylmethionine-dependent methyltransferase